MLARSAVTKSLLNKRHIISCDNAQRLRHIDGVAEFTVKRQDGNQPALIIYCGDVVNKLLTTAGESIIRNKSLHEARVDD